MNNKIKCGKCKKIFQFEFDRAEIFTEIILVRCSFCNVKNKIVNEGNNTKTENSIKCRKCSISLDEYIVPNKNLINCFKCGTTNSRTPSSKNNKLIDNDSRTKKKIPKKSEFENNLIEGYGVRELYTNQDGYLENYTDRDYSDPEDNSEPNGPYEHFYDNGFTSERGTFKNNNWYGLYEEYYYNGNLKVKCFYDHNSELSGSHEFYFENNQLAAKDFYVNGQVDGPYERYYPNGNLEEKGTHKEGWREGPYEKYYANGNLKEKGVIKEGWIIEGPYEEFYENGNLKESGADKDNEPEGPYKYYLNNGQLEMSGVFIEGFFEIDFHHEDN